MSKNKYANLFNYFRQCPMLSKLWSVAAVEEHGVRVILPQGASPAWQYRERKDVYGNYYCDKIPNVSLFESPLNLLKHLEILFHEPYSNMLKRLQAFD